MYLVKENEVYKREREKEFTLKETITLKQPTPIIYEKSEYDWYMTVALEKVDKVTQDRHLLTSELILRYRWAIREGYNHELDHNLKNKYDYPRNQNTVRGIQIYIERIEKASNAEMTELKNE
jgi:plasmid maintenance system antidote protein VapI